MKSVVLALTVVLGTTALLASGESATAERQLRVGYVLGAGETPDRDDLFGLPYDGFIRAVEALGVEGRVLQVAPNQDATGVLTFLARQKYDLVVMGTPDPWSVALVAPKYPDTRFYLPDMPVQALRQALVDLRKANPQVVPRLPKNVQGTVFRAEEAGYLAGYLSGLMEKRRPGRDVVGSVGGYDFEGVNRWIVGYQAGARRAAPGIVTLKTYTKNFTNPQKCRAAALAQIAQGAGAVFNVAGACGLGALEAAKEKGVWGVGVDVDQSFLGPHILTSCRDRARRFRVHRDPEARHGTSQDRREHGLRPPRRRRQARQDQPGGAAVRPASGRSGSTTDHRREDQGAARLLTSPPGRRSRPGQAPRRPRSGGTRSS